MTRNQAITILRQTIKDSTANNFAGIPATVLVQWASGQLSADVVKGFTAMVTTNVKLSRTNQSLNGTNVVLNAKVKQLSEELKIKVETQKDIDMLEYISRHEHDARVKELKEKFVKNLRVIEEKHNRGLETQKASFDKTISKMRRNGYQ